MKLKLHADPPRLYETDDGVVRISGTRIPLERVVRAFLAGSTPEQIAHDYDVLSIEDVYAVVNYYLHHRPEVDAYVAEAERAAANVRGEIERRHDPAGIRARLLARRSVKADSAGSLSVASCQDNGRELTRQPTTASRGGC